MKNEEIIEKYYKEAVSGLNEIVLNDKDLWYNYVINLPINLQTVYTTVVFHQQIFNGGLHQYFFNSYGQFAYLTVEHLKLIKAFKTSDILEKAIRKVNTEGFKVNEFREKVFNREFNRISDFDEELCNFLELLDDEYDNLNEDFEQLLMDYLQMFLQYVITIAEPWNFESPDGKNIIKGKILSIINNHLLIFKANYLLNFDGVSGDILILSPRSKEGNFDNIETKEVDVNGGLFLDNFNDEMDAVILKDNCKFVLIGTLKN